MQIYILLELMLIYSFNKDGGSGLSWMFVKSILLNEIRVEQ